MLVSELIDRLDYILDDAYGGKTHDVASSLESVLEDLKEGFDFLPADYEMFGDVSGRDTLDA